MEKRFIKPKPLFFPCRFLSLFHNLDMIDLQASAQINSSSFLFLPSALAVVARIPTPPFPPSPPHSPCRRAVLKFEAAGSSLVEGCEFGDRKL